MQFPFQLLSSSEFDVVGFGTNAVDHLIGVGEYPSFDSKVELTRYAKEAGGEVATTLVGLQRLGWRTAYAGRFGDDPEGRLGMQTLDEEGVNTAFAEVIADAATQIAFSIIDEQTGERTIIWHRDHKLSYSPSEAPLEAAVLGKILHTTAHDTLACIEMARAARKHGVIVCSDIDNEHENIVDLLPLVDIFTASAELPLRLTGLADERSALSQLASRFGCKIVGMTRGQNGSLMLCEGVFIETARFDVPGGCRDTTGAGDAFRTGFIYGLLKGESVETSARLANMVAALSCRGIGARSGLPTRVELSSFLKNL